MSYTLKIILISMGAWLGLGAACLGLSLLGSDSYSFIVGLVGIFVIGGLISLGLIITAVVILLGKMDGKAVPNKQGEVLDDNRQMVPIPYRERGLAFLAAGGLILLVGGSVCLGMV